MEELRDLKREREMVGGRQVKPHTFHIRCTVHAAGYGWPREGSKDYDDGGVSASVSLSY